MAEWKRIEYRGWQNCYQFKGDAIKLIVTGDVGPRIIYCGGTGGVNQFYENTLDLGCSGDQAQRFYGGHRFWTAPEDKVRTYVPDNFPVDIEICGSTLQATAPVEACGIQKTINIELLECGNCVKIAHLLVNKGSAPVELAPWGVEHDAPGWYCHHPDAAKDLAFKFADANPFLCPLGLHGHHRSPLGLGRAFSLPATG